MYTFIVEPQIITVICKACGTEQELCRYCSNCNTAITLTEEEERLLNTLGK